MLLAVLILVAAAAGRARNDLSEGVHCTYEGLQGTCRRLSQCPPAIEDLQIRQKRPQHCSFVHWEPVVCCSERVQDTSVTPPGIKEKENITIGTFPIQAQAGAIAKRKCEEYAKIVVQEKPSFALSWLGRKENMTQCANPGDAFVTGGIEAKLKEFPHMAMLEYEDGNNYCGGSLISPLYVLTAAHCTRVGLVPRWVVVGDLDRSTDQDGAKPQRLRVAEIYRHPEYIDVTKYYDIALLRLEGEAVLSEFVRPACLQTEHALPLDPAPIATGWGRLSSDGDRSDRLMKVRLPLQKTSLCNESYDNEKVILPRGILEDTQVCAGDLTGSKDTCPGDSGGPLQLFSTQAPLYCMHHIIGVTSFGRQCGLYKNTPAIYTRVSTFVAWIEKIVWPDDH